MNKEEKTPAPQVSVTFETAKQMVILRPKSTPVEAIIYKGFDDLESLIGFVGSRPALNPDLTLQFKKQVVKPGSVVTRNSFGEVVAVMTLEQASERFDIAASAPYDPARDANKVQAKPVKERKPKN